LAQFKVSSKVNSFRFKNQRYHPGDIVEISEEDAAKINGNFLISVSDQVKEEIVEIQVAEANKDVNLPAAEEPPVIDDSKKKKPKAKTFQVEQ
jgi:hypothetical protein